MKWKKIRRIFEPLEHQLNVKSIGFAQSPQTLVFDDFIRIYFSTREMDSTGKFLSHVSFADFDKNFKILNTATEIVIPLGELGTYDEHGIFPLNILRDEDKIMGFVGGWNRRVSVSMDGSIGLAISHDNGNSFKKIGNGPILTSSLNEPFLVGDPFVLKNEGLYHMWYIYGVRWIKSPEESDPQRVYKIAHATSKDCINWEKESKPIVSDKLNVNECQALPTVIKQNGLFHMFFCYRESFDFRTNSKNAYRLGYAFSEDLVNWTRDDNQVGIEVSSEGWDSEMLCYPHVFNAYGNIYLLYNGNQFGRNGFGIAILEN